MAERGNSFLRKLDYLAGIPATLPCAIWRRLDFGKKKRFLEPCRIGLICLGAMGDLLLLSGLINGIHKKWPNCAIELIVSKANSLAVPLIPHVTGHFAAPVSSVGGFVKWLRSRSYDILFDSSQWARIGSVLSATSKAGITVGFRTASQWRSCGYDVKVEHCATKHELENFLALGNALWPDFHGEPELAIAKTTAEADNIIYCHMHPAPGPGRHLKEWPAWAELINILAANGYEIRLTGSETDIKANEMFLAQCFPNAQNIHSIAGKISLAELAAQLANAAAVISVNTGIMHLASLAGAPTIGLHGATNPERWGPTGPRSISLLPEKGQFAYLNLGFEYPKNAVSAMGHLPVAKVLKALAKFGIRAFSL